MQVTKAPRSVLRFFMQLIWEHKWKCLLMSVLNILWGFSESVTPYLLKKVVDSLHTYEHTREVGFVVIWWLLVGIVAFVFIKNFIQKIADILTQGYVEPAIQASIRLRMLEYVMGHSYRFYEENLSGSVANKIDQVADSFLEMYEAFEHWIMPVLWSFIFSIIMLWQTHAVCAIIVIVWFVVMLALSAILSIYGVAYANAHAEAYNLLFGNIVNVLQNIFTVKMFARQRGEVQYIGKFQKKEVEAVQRMEWFLVTVRVVLMLACIAMLAGLTFFLLYGWRDGVITVGDVAFVMTTCFNMINTVWWLSSHLSKFYKQYGIASQCFTVMSTPHEVIDVPKARDIKITKGEIVLHKVSFRFKGNPAFFSNISLTIKAGEKIGLVGSSGSGKTTFVHLLMRFFDLKGGSISIDGQDISQVTQDSLRRSIAYIPQEPMLFARRVKDNLAYGRSDASKREILTAIEEAHAEFIKKLPAGDNTVLGERGTNLSGGQRQRLAIARAILKKAPLLILDEATSALDSITERHIQESLDQLMHDRTAIVVAHRLSTLQNMDRLLVFDNGRIVEQGSHEELVAIKDGYYAKLWHMQVGGMLVDAAERE